MGVAIKINYTILITGCMVKILIINGGHFENQNGCPHKPLTFCHHVFLLLLRVYERYLTGWDILLMLCLLDVILWNNAPN